MGKGNVQLKDKGGRNVSTFYIDFPDFEEKDEEGEYYWSQDDPCGDFKEYILNVLEECGLDIVRPHVYHSELTSTYNGHAVEVARGDNAMVIMEDNECSYALAIIPSNKYGYVPEVTKSVILQLKQYFELRVRCSPWTSSVV